MDGKTLPWEQEQCRLKSNLVLSDVKPWQVAVDGFPGLKYIGGVDISFNKKDPNTACACLVVLSYPQLKVVYKECEVVTMETPYIPGFLAFREAGFLIDLIKKVEHKGHAPQVIMVDGNGILHPKGVCLGIPCVGVAKKLFQVDGLTKDVHHLQKVKELKRGGDSFPLLGKSGKILGVALRSTDKTTNPVYVSVGHQISLETASYLVFTCCKHRIPEPTRQADLLSREHLRLYSAE